MLYICIYIYHIVHISMIYHIIDIIYHISYIRYYILHIIYYILYSIYYVLYIIFYIYYILYLIYYILYIIYYILYSIYYILIYYILYPPPCRRHCVRVPVYLQSFQPQASSSLALQSVGASSWSLSVVFGLVA